MKACLVLSTLLISRVPDVVDTKPLAVHDVGSVASDTVHGVSVAPVSVPVRRMVGTPWNTIAGASGSGSPVDPVDACDRFTRLCVVSLNHLTIVVPVLPLTHARRTNSSIESSGCESSDPLFASLATPVTLLSSMLHVAWDAYADPGRDGSGVSEIVGISSRHAGIPDTMIVPVIVAGMFVAVTRPRSISASLQVDYAFSPANGQLAIQVRNPTGVDIAMSGVWSYLGYTF